MRAFSRRDVAGMLAASPASALVRPRRPAPRASGEPVWSGWRPVPGGMGTMCAPCASADINCTLYLVVRGADSRIYYNSVVARAVLEPLRQIPGGAGPRAAPARSRGMTSTTATP